MKKLLSFLFLICSMFTTVVFADDINSYAHDNFKWSSEVLSRFEEVNPTKDKYIAMVQYGGSAIKYMLYMVPDNVTVERDGNVLRFSETIYMANKTSSSASSTKFYKVDSCSFSSEYECEVYYSGLSSTLFTGLSSNYSVYNERFGNLNFRVPSLAETQIQALEGLTTDFLKNSATILKSGLLILALLLGVSLVPRLIHSYL